MEKNVFCRGLYGNFSDSFYECESCGNHICIKRARELGNVCPNCFGRLFKIS